MDPLASCELAVPALIVVTDNIHFMFGGFHPHHRLLHYHQGIFLLLQKVRVFFPATDLAWEVPLSSGMLDVRRGDLLPVDPAQKVAPPLKRRSVKIMNVMKTVMATLSVSVQVFLRFISD